MLLTILKIDFGYKFRIIPDSTQTVTLILNSKTLSISTTELPVEYTRIDILDESIEEINKIFNCVYNREKLEGKDYTNGNLNREV